MPTTVYERDNANQYGNAFWIIEKADGGHVALFADQAEVTASGAAVFYGKFYETDDHGVVDYQRPRSDSEQVLLCLPAGQWTTFFAASMLDGSPVAVERWVNT